MKILVVSPRMPADGGKGDQLRALQFARALAGEHSVEIVTTGAGVGGTAGPVGLSVPIHLTRASTAARGAAGLGALLRGQPFQVGWMMPGRCWHVVRQRAETCDVVLAITVRAVRGSLAVPVVLDHVDALSVNMRRRANGPETAPVRWAARLEAMLLDRWEHRLRRHVAAQTAISPLDAEVLPRPPVPQVVPNCVELPPPLPTGGERDLDLILTGNMAYPPNRDAARWLSDSIAPKLWARRPETSIWVVGRSAAALTLDPRIEVRADVPALTPFLQRARIAIAPLRLGTGSPNKVLEAMAAGAAVVATPDAVASFGFPPGAVQTADTSEGLASAAVDLLEDPSTRSTLVSRSSELVRAYSPEAQRERLEAVIVSVAREA